VSTSTTIAAVCTTSKAAAGAALDTTPTSGALAVGAGENLAELSRRGPGDGLGVEQALAQIEALPVWPGWSPLRQRNTLRAARGILSGLAAHPGAHRDGGWQQRWTAATVEQAPDVLAALRALAAAGPGRSPGTNSASTRVRADMPGSPPGLRRAADPTPPPFPMASTRRGPMITASSTRPTLSSQARRRASMRGEASSPHFRPTATFGRPSGRMTAA
jgi:hypothetical protein